MRMLCQIAMSIFDNLEDMDNFLEILPPKLNHEAIENLNRRETNKKIKSVIQKLQQRTTLWSFSLLNSTKHKYQLTKSFSNVFENEEGTLSNSFYEVSSSTLIQEPDKDST